MSGGLQCRASQLSHLLPGWVPPLTPRLNSCVSEPPRVKAAKSELPHMPGADGPKNNAELRPPTMSPDRRPSRTSRLRRLSLARREFAQRTAHPTEQAEQNPRHSSMYARDCHICLSWGGGREVGRPISLASPSASPGTFTSTGCPRLGIVTCIENIVKYLGRYWGV